MASYVVLTLVVLAASQALRSLLRRHRAGEGGCHGDCERCRGCH